MANFCPNCEKKLSFLQRHADDTLCGECSDALANARRAQLTQVEQAIAASRTSTPQQLTLLKTYDHRTVLDLYYRLYNRFVADKELDEHDIATQQAFLRSTRGKWISQPFFSQDTSIIAYIYPQLVKHAR